MPQLRCTSCTDSKPWTDTQLGHTICLSCGTVLEQNVVVAEVGFTEGKNGSALADGFFIGEGQAKARSGAKGGYNRFGSNDAIEQRENSLLNGYRRIQEIADAMQMTSRHVESAQSWFKSCASHNFTKGRKTSCVAAACLYIVCRMDKLGHMLIDFAEQLQLNVYVIGNTYIKLVELLHLAKEIPVLDPLMIIQRFANVLDFDDNDIGSIVLSATRLVNRMKADWIDMGRRPSGLCAAGLFIAARMHGYRRTQREIAHAVKICEQTLTKRLDEFQACPSGKLSVEEFNTLDLSSKHDPPSFISKKEDEKEETKNTRKRKAKDGDNEGEASEEDDEGEAFVREMNRIIARVQQENPAKVASDDLSYLDEDLEVKNAVCSAGEIEFKSMFWNDANKDWMEQQEFKKNNPTVKPPSKRKKNNGTTNKKPPLPPAASAAEAAKNLISITQKQMSKRINYAALDAAFEA